MHRFNYVFMHLNMQIYAYYNIISIIKLHQNFLNFHLGLHQEFHIKIISR